MQFQIETLQTVSSTQDLLKKRAAEADEGLVIHALHQTAGRGRLGRDWVSAPGNLYLSILLRPAYDVQALGMLSLAVGLALGNAMREFLKNPDDLSLKWPNDVLIAGEKCAGILIETDVTDEKLNWVVVGVGVNIAGAPPELGTYLNAHTEQSAKPSDLRDCFLEQLVLCYKAWQVQGADAIKPQWLAMSYEKGAPLQVKIAEKVIKGRFEDIDESGAMILIDEENRTRTITAGDVYLG